MTKEEIIEMAKQVKMPYFFTDGTIVNIVKLEAFAKLVAERDREVCELEAFAKLVAAKEREACLNLADSLGWVNVDHIRARGDKND
jgi:hypothetical protein